MPSGLPPPSSSSTVAVSAQNGGTDGEDCGYKEHRVSRLDTLAGIAIKYGVEVADVKRANGLVTDLQMFGHQTLKIPLPGRRHSPPKKPYKKKVPSKFQKKNVSPPAQLLQIPESKVKEKRPLSSAMNLLRGYYGLSSSGQRNSSEEGMEMISYNSDGQEFSEEEPFSPVATARNGKDMLNGNLSSDSKKSKEISRLSDAYTPTAVLGACASTFDAEKVSVRRRSKADGLNSARSCSPEFETRLDLSPPERVAKNSSVLVGSRTPGSVKFSDVNTNEIHSSKVIKSLSTSNLQDQTNLQANLADGKYGGKTEMISAMPSRSLFEGLSKPITQRYKEALD